MILSCLQEQWFRSLHHLATAWRLPVSLQVGPQPRMHHFLDGKAHREHSLCRAVSAAADYSHFCASPKPATFDKSGCRHASRRRPSRSLSPIRSSCQAAKDVASPQNLIDFDITSTQGRLIPPNLAATTKSTRTSVLSKNTSEGCDGIFMAQQTTSNKLKVTAQGPNMKVRLSAGVDDFVVITRFDGINCEHMLLAVF